MNQLIVFSSLSPGSFVKAIVDVIVATSESNGTNVKTVDLYGINFNPLLTPSDVDLFNLGEMPDDIREQRDLIIWADTIIFVYPVWWMQMPAILKGYVDRMFSLIKRSGKTKNFFHGKKVISLVTAGIPKESQDKLGITAAYDIILNQFIYGFTGMEASFKTFNNINNIDDASRKSYLYEIRNMFL